MVQRAWGSLPSAWGPTECLLVKQWDGRKEAAWMWSLSNMKGWKISKPPPSSVMWSPFRGSTSAGQKHTWMSCRELGRLKFVAEPLTGRSAEKSPKAWLVCDVHRSSHIIKGVCVMRLCRVPLCVMRLCRVPLTHKHLIWECQWTNSRCRELPAHLQARLQEEALQEVWERGWVHLPELPRTNHGQATLAGGGLWSNFDCVDH